MSATAWEKLSDWEGVAVPLFYGDNSGTMTNNRANKTSFKKGDKRRKTGVSGRRAGVPNRLNAQCKEMIATCFESIGGIEGLVAWAKKNRTAFYTRMYIRLLPVNVKVRDHKNIVYESLAEV